MIKVKKRDGSYEDFSFQKVYQSIVAAGLDENEANNIARQIQTWVQQEGEEISTAEIRKRVIGLLEVKNLQVAEKYKSYKKEEDTVD